MTGAGYVQNVTVWNVGCLRKTRFLHRAASQLKLATTIVYMNLLLRYRNILRFPLPRLPPSTFPFWHTLHNIVIISHHHLFFVHSLHTHLFMECTISPSFNTCPVYFLRQNLLTYFTVYIHLDMSSEGVCLVCVQM